MFHPEFLILGGTCSLLIVPHLNSVMFSYDPKVTSLTGLSFMSSLDSSIRFSIDSSVMSLIFHDSLNLFKAQFNKYSSALEKQRFQPWKPWVSFCDRRLRDVF